MSLHYALGVATAVFCGVCMQSGILLQKKAVNDMAPEDRVQRFLKTLLRDRRWLAGLGLEYGIGTCAFMVAQALIGPALVPGLMAAGLVVLAVGSVRLIGESLDFSEVVGIVLLIASIVLLGLSELEISVDVVRERLGDPGTATRVAVLTVSLFVLWAATHLQAMRLSRRKGIVMAFSNGFPFAISNFWISPLLAVGAVVLAGDGSWGQTGLFVLASVILVSCNVLGIRQTNEAFKWAQASNVIPVQQLSVQVTPVFFYFYVYALEPPRAASGVLIVAGAALVVVAAFLLGRRQAEVEQIH